MTHKAKFVGGIGLLLDFFLSRQRCLASCCILQHSSSRYMLLLSNEPLDVDFICVLLVTLLIVETSRWISVCYSTI